MAAAQATDHGRLLSADATDTEAPATGAAAADATPPGRLLGGPSGGRARAGALAAALVLGVVASALAAAATLGRDAAESEEEKKAPLRGEVAQLWGSGGGGCAAQGCQCDCGWAASPNACIPQANDGHCCWSCCCGGGGAFGGDPGFAARPGYDQLAMGPGDAYHESYAQRPVYGQAPEYYRGQQGMSVAYAHAGHYHVYHHKDDGGALPYVWWVVLIILSLLACVGVYLYLRPPAK